MTTALKRDLSIDQGSDFAISFQVNLSGDVFDDSWNVHSQIRKTPTSSAVLHEWSKEAGNVAINGNVMTLTVPAATSSAWTFTSAVYDLEISNADSTKTYRILEGRVKVSKNVTR